MKYIGIRGHRGAGKNTVAFLLGNTINHLLTTKDFNKERFDSLFQIWCDDIVTDERIIHTASLEKVYFESFSDSLKLIIQLLLGCPQDFLYSDYHKDHTIVNVRDFSYRVYDNIPEDMQIYNSTELYNIMSVNPPATIVKNTYITLREFILYFGKDVMQRYFGLNVWVKTLRSSQDFFSSIFIEQDEWKIYTDVKTPAEVTYIKGVEKNRGYIVKVSRPGHKKQSRGIDRLNQDNRYDYEVIIKGELVDIKDNILEIAKKIINNEAAS